MSEKDILLKLTNSIMKLNYFKIVILMIVSLILCKLVNAGELPKLKSNKNNYWQKREAKRQENLKNCAASVKVKSEKVRKSFAKEGVALSQTNLKTTSTSSLIEIPADTVINVNTIWSQDVHLNGKVYVENAVLIIKPGVVVWNSTNGGIDVRNNGSY